jgi:glutathione peroxidase
MNTVKLFKVTVLSTLLIFTSCTKSNSKIESLKTEESKMSSIYEQKINGLDGKPIDLNQYKGKPLMFVNIATKCGYTPQLDGLEALNKKYEAKGFKLIGLPSNDFGGQTPEDAEGIKKFCKLNHGVSFELSEKILVKNPEPKGLVDWLVQNSESKSPVKWNFEKFVINKEGKLTARFESKVEPLDKALVEAVEQVL